MTRITSALFVAALLAVFLHVASAHAQFVRTCVSLAKGNDANSCHCATPCRTFARAHTQTLSDGEITVLDPGDYGGLTISKSISINNDSGGEASVTVSGNNTAGITVNAPNGAGYVNLRGITIQGVGFGNNQFGLLFNTGFSLTMTHCVVRNIVGTGIGLGPNAASRLAVSNTLVADNGGSGILVLPLGAGVNVKAEFNRVQVFTNSNGGIVVSGVASAGTINATVADSVIANNNDQGVAAGSLTDAATTSVMVIRSAVVNNATGLLAAGPPATLRVGQSTITGNTTGLSASNGAGLLSYSDNNIDGNGAGTETPTGTISRK
jgi:hypothetical protein